MSDKLDEEAARAGRARERAMSRETRRAHGVVHTPVELARFGAARVDALLRSELGLRSGLGDGRVAIVDPSVGTGIWLGAALSLACTEETTPVWALGLDIDAAALDEARALLTSEAAARGWTLVLKNANTLAEPSVFEDDTRVRVILGNPPWAARSSSRGTVLSDAMLEDFRRDEHGARLRERRLGVLSDDYVRFFRWSIEQARSSQCGAALCLATNASYLDGPIHRGMRRMLSETYDLIEVIDLGGNSLLSRAGERDENVFGVRVSVALTVAIRRANTTNTSRSASLSYTRVRGDRGAKLAALSGLETGARQSFTPQAPSFLFVPRASSLRVAQGFALDEVFPFHREGIQTNRDALCVADDEPTLRERLRAFAEGQIECLPSRHFNPEHARRVLRERLYTEPESLGTRVAYRPFDERFVCVVAPLCHRPRPELLRACARSSLCLLSARKDRGAKPWSLIAATRVIADNCYLSNLSSCRTRVFPSHDEHGRENVDPEIRQRLGDIARQALSSEQVITFVAGALASPRYRTAHDDDLKGTYPRVPWPRDAPAFFAFLEAGRTWLEAFLLAPDELRNALLTDTDARDELRAADAEVGHFRLARAPRFSGDVGRKELFLRVHLWARAGRMADDAHQTNGSV